MASCRLAALCLALAAVHSLGEQVETLTTANFQKRIELSDIILVKFYAPWCGHCREMAPAYEEAAQKLAKHTPPIPLGNVDATQEPRLAQDHGVRGYPTLKIFRKGAASDYGGPRGPADGIVKYMLEQLCRDQTCTDENFPILDYSESEDKCICAAHPCWDDAGKTHQCENPQYPHLKFSYTQEGTLECGCSMQAHYTSTYIAKVKCPGEHCDEAEHPLLDYDPRLKKCLCRSHPCHDLDGVRHDCSDPKFPILIYREEMEANGGVKKVCECKTIDKKKEEL